MDPNKKIYSVLLIEHELIQKKIMINLEVIKIVKLDL